MALSERRGGSMPMRELLDCKLSGIRVTDIATYFEQTAGQIRLDAVSAGWLIFGDGFNQGFLRTTVKRLFDIVCALVLLMLASPVMLVTALVIRLESPGGILYRQERVGLEGKPFDVVKFRSMRTDAEKDGVPRWATAGDSRVTRVGKVIRKLRIDELPQLLSVLLGHMSLVGPRPERPYFVDQLTQEIPFYAVRHSVKPGVTGWAQVSYQYGSSQEDTVNKLQYDLYYVKNHSLFLDLVILFRDGGCGADRQGCAVGGHGADAWRCKHAMSDTAASADGLGQRPAWWLPTRCWRCGCWGRATSAGRWTGAGAAVFLAALPDRCPGACWACSRCDRRSGGRPRPWPTLAATPPGLPFWSVCFAVRSGGDEAEHGRLAGAAGGRPAGAGADHVAVLRGLGSRPSGRARRCCFSRMMALPLLGLVLVEQLFRNLPEDALWNAKPISLGLAGMFLYDFYLFSQAVLFNGMDPDALSIRGVVHAALMPLLLLSTTRHRNWIAKIQVSHKVVFHSATLLMAGRLSAVHCRRGLLRSVLRQRLGSRVAAGADVSGAGGAGGACYSRARFAPACGCCWASTFFATATTTATNGCASPRRCPAQMGPQGHGSAGDSRPGRHAGEPGWRALDAPPGRAACTGRWRAGTCRRWHRPSLRTRR